MASAADAVEAAGSPLHIVTLPHRESHVSQEFTPIDAPSANSEQKKKIIHEIRQQLSRNRPVLVKGGTPDARGDWGFTLVDLENIFSNMDQIIDVQGSPSVFYPQRFHVASQLRTFSDLQMRIDNPQSIAIHKELPLRDFVVSADSPDVCLNALDLPALTALEMPWLIRFDRYKYLTLLLTNVVLSQRCLDDSASALEATKREYYGQSARGDVQYLGPQTMRFDTWRSKAWFLLCHAGFLTYSHHDSNGLCTYVYIIAGVKYWSLLKLLDANGPKTKIRADYYKLHEKIVQTENSYREACDLYNIYLEPGNLLSVFQSGNYVRAAHLLFSRLQPPGYWHQVYTPVKTIAAGGHFLCYETLHLTEFARFFDQKYQKAATNTDHDSIMRILPRMAIALPSLAERCSGCLQFFHWPSYVQLCI